MTASGTQANALLRYGLVIPLLFAIGLFLLYPIGYSFWISLNDYEITRLDDVKFSGVENYSNLTDDDAFANAMVNTLVFVISAVTLELVLGFFIAYLLFRQRKYSGLFRAILLSPMFVTPIAVGLIFRFLLNSQLGIIPYLLGQVDISIDFFGPQLALISIIMIDVWQWTPFMILLLLAGMESLPEEPFESAVLDGATGWRLLMYLLFPLLRPTIMAAIIIRSLDAFKVFEYIWAITRGGPGESTEVMLFHIYKEGFRFFRMGQAAAMGYVLVIVIILLCLFIFWLLAALPAWLARRRANHIAKLSSSESYA